MNEFEKYLATLPPIWGSSLENEPTEIESKEISDELYWKIVEQLRKEEEERKQKIIEIEKFARDLHF